MDLPVAKEDYWLHPIVSSASTIFLSDASPLTAATQPQILQGAFG